MRVLISEVEPATHPTGVLLRTAAGTARAIWKSRSIEPLAGRTATVEFDVDTVLRLGDNAKVVGAGPASLVHDGDGTTVHALVESSDEDNMLFLRLTPDGLIMVEGSGEIRAGTWLRFHLRQDELVASPAGTLTP